MNVQRIKRLIRHGVVIGVAVGAVIVGASRIQAAASSSGIARTFPAPARPAGQHGFIILPEVDQISVESLLTSTSNITVSFVLATGTISSTTTDVLPQESMGIYAAPAGFPGGSSQIDVETSAGTGNTPPVFATNFKLADSGNSAYLGFNTLTGYESYPNCTTSIRFVFPSCIPLVVKARDGATSRFVVRNYGVQFGNLAINFYDSSGLIAVTTVMGVPANGSFSIDLADVPGLPDGFVGSVEIDSDQPIGLGGASVSANGPPGISSDYRSGDPLLSGMPLIAPALFAGHDLQTSELCIQNAFSSTQAVTVTYSDGLTRTAQIPEAVTHCFNQGSEGHLAGWMGGAVISATNPLLGVVNVTARSANTVVGRWAYAVPSQTQITSKALALPLLFNDYKTTGSLYGWTTSIYLYNPGNSLAIVTPRYTSADGKLVDCATEITISAKSQIAIPQPLFASISMGYLTSTQPIAAVVSGMSNKPLGDTDRHFGYEAAYLDALVTPQRTCNVHQVYLPLIKR